MSVTKLLVAKLQLLFSCQIVGCQITTFIQIPNCRYQIVTTKLQVTKLSVTKLEEPKIRPTFKTPYIDHYGLFYIKKCFINQRLKIFFTSVMWCVDSAIIKVGTLHVLVLYGPKRYVHIRSTTGHRFQGEIYLLSTQYTCTVIYFI